VFFDSWKIVKKIVPQNPANKSHIWTRWFDYIMQNLSRESMVDCQTIDIYGLHTYIHALAESSVNLNVQVDIVVSSGTS
jgi:hypothetical protein